MKVADLRWAPIARDAEASQTLVAPDGRWYAAIKFGNGTYGLAMHNRLDVLELACMLLEFRPKTRHDRRPPDD